MDFTKYRLFDAIEFQLQSGPKKDMLNAKENGRWKNYSTKDVAAQVNNLTAGLLRAGISAGQFTAESSDKVAIISNSRPEWVITDMAVQQTGAILVPIYPTTTAAEIEFILNDAEAKILFISDAAIYKKIKELNTPHLKNIYAFDEVENVAHYSTLLQGITPENLRAARLLKDAVPVTHTATIIYTSGTTGTPKGVMLSHKNIVSNTFFSKQSFPFPYQPQARVLSFLPLNHIFEKMVTYIYLYSGIGIYYAESVDTIAENLKEIKPTGFTTVPRLLEKVYEKIMATGKELTGVKRALFFWSVSLAVKYNPRQPQPLGYKTQLAIARKLVLNKWKAALGGNIEFIITGGAAASEKLLRIFNAAEIPVYEGYGPTEHSPVIAVNRKNDNYYGTVGQALMGVTMKLAEDGEILAHSDCVMQGYYKQPAATDEVLKGGWLHTGDVGILIENKYLKITDRKKELFKTSGGKYVAPQPIENKMKESRYIEQIMVVGADKKFVSALIVPAYSALKNWAKENNIAYSTNSEMVENAEIKKLIRGVLNQYNEQFNKVEQVKKFTLLPQDWSLEGGELTPKMSLRRKIILEKYGAEIDKMYKEQEV